MITLLVALIDVRNKDWDDGGLYMAAFFLDVVLIGAVGRVLS